MNISFRMLSDRFQAVCCFAAVLAFTAVSLHADISLDSAKTVILPEARCRFASKELALHLGLIAGSKFNIYDKDQTLSDKFVIHVGKLPPGTVNTFKPEEGRWLFTPDAAYFYGDGPAGTLNAIYDFLENELDVRWPYGTEISYRARSPIIVKKLSGGWAPALRLREIRKAGNSDMDTWIVRMRGGEHNPPHYGHAFTQWWNRFGKEHPEYFALNNGRRSPINPSGSRLRDITISNSRYSQMIALCVSNDDVVKQVIRDWDNRSDFINICENDAPAARSCHCDKCIALDPKHSNELNNDMGADRYILFANKVAAEAAKRRPDVKVAMYAYNASEQPPVSVKVSPNVLIGIVPVDFRLDKIKDYVRRWKSAGMSEFFYRPNRHHYFCPMGFPLGNDKHSFDIFKFMYDSGSIAFDYDAPARYDIFRWHNDYILSHAMNYPDLPFEYWEKHFGQAYGEACDEIVEYFRYWRGVWDKRICPKLGELANRENWAYFSRSFFPRAGEFYTMDDFKESDLLLEKALKKNLSKEERRRVKEIKIFHDHAALMLDSIQNKTADASFAVAKFRKAHGMPEIMPYEEEYGDICGVKIDKLKQFDPPYIDTPLFWHFRLDQTDAGEKEKWFRCDEDYLKWDGFMPTDSPWEKPAMHYEHPSQKLRRQTADYDGIAWYACKVKVPDDWKGNRDIFIYFGAVDESADVWLNGKKAGSHPFVSPNDWEIPFTLNISSLVDWSAKEQTLVVKVTDNEGAGGIWKRVFIVSKLKKK